ncbi:glycoside hydrolase family 78 protein [Bacillus solitudinis]
MDSGERKETDSLAYTPDLQLESRTLYFWRVTVWGDSGNKATSEVAWFGR